MGERRLDRWLRPRYVFPVLAMLVVVVVIFTPVSDEGTGLPELTTYASQPYGARGLYEVMARLGWHVTRRRLPFQAPLDSTAIYAVLAPPMQPTATEVHALLTTVRRGAGAIVVPSPGSPLADSLGVQLSFGSAFEFRVVPSSIARDTVAAPAVEHAAVEVGGFRNVLAPVPRNEEDTTPRFPADTRTLVRVESARGAAPAIMARRFGRGRVIAIADPRFLRNGVVREGDAAVLAVRLFEWLDPARRAPVVFDEYHQGYSDEPGMFDTLRDALLLTAPGRGFVELLVAGALLLLALGVRPIAPVSRRVVERRSPLEHVGALSRAYEQIGATRLATRRLVRGVRRRHPLGVTGALDDDEYLALLRRRKPELAPQVDVLRSALQRTLPAADWVAIGGAIDSIERTMTQ